MVIKINRGTFIKKESIVQYEIERSGISNNYILNVLLSNSSLVKIAESPSYEILESYIEKLESPKILESINKNKKESIIDINYILGLK